MADAVFNQLTEDKIQKSLRNTSEFNKALERANKGDFDVDTNDATGEDFLKVTEKWTIRKEFNLNEGKHYYRLWKEVFYIQNPHKYYFDVVEPTVYRRIAKQSEHGDIEWAKSVSKERNVPIVED